MQLPDTFILFDGEYTAWEGSNTRNWTGPGEYEEVVQIAAIKVDKKDLSVISTYTQFVKPTINPKLSEYFMNLTGITQEQVDTDGLPLSQALAEFHTWCDHIPLFSYGLDMKVISKNCELVNIPCPFQEYECKNIRDIFDSYGIDTAQFTSGTITKAFGVNPKLKAHDALNDSLTILDGIKLLEQAQQSKV